MNTNGAELTSYFYYVKGNSFVLKSVDPLNFEPWVGEN